MTKNRQKHKKNLNLQCDKEENDGRFEELNKKELEN